jgi:hypothetical protein
VLDFELASIADPLIDYAILLLKYSDDKTFVKSLKASAYLTTVIADVRSLHALTTYILIFALYDLGFENGLHKLDLDLLTKTKRKGYLP